MNPPFYRTFVAVPIRVGPLYLAQVEGLKRSLEGTRISWVPPDRYHVTLRFLGDTEPARVERIAEGLQKRHPWPAAAQTTLFGWGLFGPQRNPRVIWAGFRDPGIFMALKAAVDEVLNAAGLPLGKEPLAPHLTLGRIRTVKDPSRIPSVLAELPAPDESAIPVDRVVYYRSILQERGPEYVPLQQVRLPTPGRSQS